ncbi:MBL fold metallo-hydrolase [Collimonas sp. H4R21]|uniref:MBL fold metallo-hydrolase n=1 Tax=Collimonas rhizosphaerae TaxID=3126357 RepID=A0ABU9Q1J3_9BURK
MDHTSFPLRHLLSGTALAVSLALGAGAIPTAAFAAAPQVKTQAPGFYRVMLGDFEVTALSDGTVDLPVDKLLDEPAAKTTAALRKSFLDVPAETSVNGFLINTGTKLVLIDTGAGTLFGPTLGKLTASLQAAGYKPEQVDDIFLTHMHPDHLGGLVANGALAFPNATVHADKRDADFWLSKAKLEQASADSKGSFQGAVASLNPYIAAGKFQPFDGSGEIVPGVKAWSSYGHTAGHTSYVVESKGQKLIVTGDLIHVGAVQFADPAVTIEFDTDKKTAAVARAKVFTAAAKEGALIGAAHISFPGLGHLRAAGKSWQWIPVNYTTELK